MWFVCSQVPLPSMDSRVAFGTEHSQIVLDRSAAISVPLHVMTARIGQVIDRIPAQGTQATLLLKAPPERQSVTRDASDRDRPSASILAQSATWEHAASRPLGQDDRP